MVVPRTTSIRETNVGHVELRLVVLLCKCDVVGFEFNPTLVNVVARPPSSPNPLLNFLTWETHNLGIPGLAMLTLVPTRILYQPRDQQPSIPSNDPPPAMDSIIEVQRQAHEEAERYEQALAEILIKPTTGVRSS